MRRRVRRAERKKQRLSSRKRKGSGRKEAERKWKIPKAKAEGKHLRNSCGSESGKGERKLTESRVQKPGRKAREIRPEIKGKPRKRERKRAPGKQICFGRTGKRRKGKKQKAE